MLYQILECCRIPLAIVLGQKNDKRNPCHRPSEFCHFMAVLHIFSMIRTVDHSLELISCSHYIINLVQNRIRIKDGIIIGIDSSCFLIFH